MKNQVLKIVSLVGLCVMLMGCKGGEQKGQQGSTSEVFLFASNDPVERVRKLVGTQTFSLKLQEPEFVVGKKGTVLYVKPNSFVYEDGSPVKGEIQVELGEIITMTDFIKSGISTVSDGKMLTTGGTFFIEARQGDKKLKINPETGLGLMVPALKKDPEMKLFLAESTPDAATGPINWKLADKPDQSPVLPKSELSKSQEKILGNVSDAQLLERKYNDFKTFMLMIRDYKLEGDYYYDANRYDNLEKAGLDKVHKPGVDSVKEFIQAYEIFKKSAGKNQQFFIQKNKALKEGLKNYKEFMKGQLGIPKDAPFAITQEKLDSIDRSKMQHYFKGEVDMDDVVKYLELNIFQSYGNFYNCDRFTPENKPTTYVVKFDNINESNLQNKKLHLVCRSLNYHAAYKIDNPQQYSLSFPAKIPFEIIFIKKTGEILSTEYDGKSSNKELRFNIPNS